MRLGSLFSGYGGLDMAAADVFGARPMWFVDNEPSAAAVLAHHYPHVPNLGDVTAVDWPNVDPVDVLTGGFPCQDISNAGRRAGIEGERSGLWAHFARAIGVLRPRYVLVENVAALLVRGFDVVAADLAHFGYRFGWCVLGAADVGAPHRRNRLFVVASPDTADDGHERSRLARHGWAGPAYGRHAATDADRNGLGIVQRVEPSVGTRHDVDGRGPRDWGDYGPAVDRWAHLTGRPAPAPTETGARGGAVLAPRFVEWLMGLPAGHVTDVPGLTRAKQLRLLGNGVVPQQASAALAHLAEVIA